MKRRKSQREKTPLEIEVDKWERAAEAERKANEFRKTGLYITSHPMMGYDKEFVHFIFAGARGRGKSVLSLDAAIDSCKKYGYENNKIFFFRLSDTSVKSLLANGANDLIDPLLIHKYDMEISRKGNVVYDHGKKLLEVYALASAAKNKGKALYDWAFLNDRPIDPKTGKPIKRFIWLILDEFQIAEGLERKDMAAKSTASLWRIYTETIVRDQEFLDYPAIRCIYCANNVAECSTFTSEMWGYYMSPGDFRVVKCRRKNAVFFNVPNSEAYIDKRKRGVMGSITNFDDDSNYSNEVKMDLSMIKPRKRQLHKVTALIKFGKEKDKWFCIYDGQYVRRYRKETVSKNLIIPMIRHLDDMFTDELVKDVFERYDANAFIYADVISLANFRARMKELKTR